MRFFNTLGRQKGEFKPLKAGEVKLYTCGPTVYDYAHIGNLRSFVFDDTLRRTLELNQFKVKHVMNITDVGHLVSDMDEGEDKLEAGASREGKSVWQVAEHYAQAFADDAAALNLLPPNGYRGNEYARATDFIDEQVEIVKILLDKGFAYLSEQAIYFDVTKLPSYGELSGQRLADKEIGAREQVVTDKNKHHPQDFALWFFLVGRFAHHTMHWQSPWGAGFPGWHLECSAIIHKTLADPIDIHTGGVDHIGTHHPNEMAQTEAAFGHKLANYWLHNEFVLVDGRKMAKSLGNFITLKDITDKGYEPLALRLLFLQAHYRSQLNFTWESLEAAQVLLKRLRAWAELRWQAKDGAVIISDDFKNVRSLVLSALDDDLNTASALAALSGLVQLMDEGVSTKQQKQFSDFLEDIDKIFGLGLSATKDISAELKKLISQRERARHSKDFEAADKIRQKLSDQDIEIRDTSSGPIWSSK